jgi:hypothetical protein
MGIKGGENRLTKGLPGQLEGQAEHASRGHLLNQQVSENSEKLDSAPPSFFLLFCPCPYLSLSRLASESPLLVQARRIALGDCKPVVLANLGSDRYPPASPNARAGQARPAWQQLLPYLKGARPNVAMSEAFIKTSSCVRLHAVKRAERSPLQGCSLNHVVGSVRRADVEQFFGAAKHTASQCHSGPGYEPAYDTAGRGDSAA